MASRKEEFITGEIYHVTVRGIDGRRIFIDDEDHWRGIFSLYEFNTRSTVTIRNQRLKRQAFKEACRGLSAVAVPEVMEDRREKLVYVAAFVFMPNHIHLILRQLVNGGVSLFMQKLGSGYSCYFNERYKRSGHLFQGKFASNHISGDEYLKTVFVYIHVNPISLIEPGWKTELVRDPGKAKQFLEEYRWSSYPDYIGKKNFPSITERELIIKIFGTSATAKQFVDSWIDHRSKSLSAPTR
jgi:putative transposase